MTKKNQPRLGWIPILLAWMIFSWACSSTTNPATSEDLETKESTMTTEKVFPKIDKTAPPLFETASFGLG